MKITQTLATVYPSKLTKPFTAGDLAPELASLLLKPVEVIFNEDRKACGFLMRNSLSNQTLCLQTRFLDWESSFFFEIGDVHSIRPLSV